MNIPSKPVRVIASLGYGALAYFLFIRIIASSGYSGSTHPSFINSRALNIGLPLLGGVLTALAFIRLSQFAARQKRKRSALLVRAGLYGIAATALTFQATFVVIAIRVAWPTASSGDQAAFALELLLALIEVETYGLIVTAFCTPFAFIYGAVLALPLLIDGHD